MGLKDQIQHRVKDAIDTVTHSLDYSRHLVLGNKVRGELATMQDGTAPVVLVHGFLGTRGTMLPLSRRLRADGRVVFTYAYGTFNLASIRASAEAFVADLRKIIEGLDVDRVDVIGYSMGGLIGLHAVKFLQAHQWVRRLILLGAPLRGSWLAIPGAAALGLVSPSVWQVLPGAPFLSELLTHPIPPGVDLRQIHAASDAFCPAPGPIEGVQPRDYVMLPGGHSSLVVAPRFYSAIAEFLDKEDDAPGPARREPAKDVARAG